MTVQPNTFQSTLATMPQSYSYTTRTHRLSQNPNPSFAQQSGLKRNTAQAHRQHSEQSNKEYAQDNESRKVSEKKAIRLLNNNDPKKPTNGFPKATKGPRRYVRNHSREYIPGSQLGVMGIRDREDLSKSVVDSGPKPNKMATQGRYIPKTGLVSKPVPGWSRPGWADNHVSWLCAII